MCCQAIDPPNARQELMRLYKKEKSCLSRALQPIKYCAPERDIDFDLTRRSQRSAKLAKESDMGSIMTAPGLPVSA